MQGLRQLADVLNIETARISGDPQRLQLALGESQSRKLQEADNLINAEIDKLNIPETQKTLLKALDTKSKADYILGGEKRKIIKGADGFQYYADTGERVLPNVVATPGEDSTGFERNKSRYLALSSKQNLSEPEKIEKNILELELLGKDLIPFFNKEGQQVATLRQSEIGLNPNILTEMANKGLYTVGSRPGFAPKGVSSPLESMQQNYLDTTSQLDTINDLATIIYENKDAFTLAGGIADLVNTGIYQVESAARALDLDKFAQTNPQEYNKYQDRLNNLLDTKYGQILDKISADRGVAKSIFLKLAYSTAKEIDPSGRLSDNDVRIAMDIIGQLGANWKKNLSVVENLSKTRERQYLKRYELDFGNLTVDADKDLAGQYGDIPKFLGGIDWNSGQALGTQTTNNQSPFDTDAILKDLGIN